MIHQLVITVYRDWEYQIENRDEDCEEIVDIFAYKINELDKAITKIIEEIFTNYTKKIEVAYKWSEGFTNILQINFEEGIITVNTQFLTHETLIRFLKMCLRNLPILNGDTKGTP